MVNMRLPIIAGNWKMHKTIKEACELVEGLLQRLNSLSDREVVVCPPYTSLYAVGKIIQDTEIKLGAQNLYCEKEGAYTGEVSPKMLIDVGCKYVIIGHSERRIILGEDDGLINKKLKIALDHGLSPILCVGERLEEREANQQERVVYNQLTEDLKDLTKEEVSRIVIAYEPVWAIGTGKTATSKDANAMHRFIRNLLSEFFDDTIAKNLRIQYGGSVKPENIDGLMAEEEIDGVLVGGASLNIESFSRIVKFKKN
jgi:triosephosphate isomerase